MNIASLVLRIFPDQRELAETALTALPGVECHGMSEDGKLVVTVEEAGEVSVSDTLIAIHSIPCVLAVTLAYEHNPHHPTQNPTTQTTQTTQTDSPCEEVQP